MSVLGFLSMPELLARVGVTQRNLPQQALELSFSVFNLVLKTESINHHGIIVHCGVMSYQ